jgi:hypothetical protein
MQKVSEAMPALIEEAFRDAQRQALEERDAACLSMGQGVGHCLSLKFGEYYT